jgi:hypothetical protein
VCLMQPGIAFQSSPARTMKKLDLVSSRPYSGRTLSGSACCHILAAAAVSGSNQSAIRRPSFPVQILYIWAMSAWWHLSSSVVRPSSLRQVLEAGHHSNCFLLDFFQLVLVRLLPWRPGLHGKLQMRPHIFLVNLDEGQFVTVSESSRNLA